MSSSLFESWDYRDYPTTYTEYNDGDKTFGEIVANDTLYYWSAPKYFDPKNIGIVELKAMGKMCISVGNYTIRVNDKSIKSVVIGSANGGYSGNGRYYTPSTAKDMSVAIGLSDLIVIGTNRDMVLKFAKVKLNEKLCELRREMECVQEKIDAYSKMLTDLAR